MGDDEAIEPPLPISLRLNSLYSVSLMDCVDSSLPEAPELDLKHGRKGFSGCLLVMGCSHFGCLESVLAKLHYF